MMWLEIFVFILGWTFLAGAGWLLYLKIRRIEQRNEQIALAAKQNQMEAFKLTSEN